MPRPEEKPPTEKDMIEIIIEDNEILIDELLLEIEKLEKTNEILKKEL